MIYHLNGTYFSRAGVKMKLLNDAHGRRAEITMVIEIPASDWSSTKRAWPPPTVLSAPYINAMATCPLHPSSLDLTKDPSVEPQVRPLRTQTHADRDTKEKVNSLTTVKEVLERAENEIRTQRSKENW